MLPGLTMMGRVLRALPDILALSTLLTVAALLALAPAQGFAQGARSLQNTPKLTSTDLAMMRKLVQQDLAGKPKGTTLSWNNPESQHSGTVTLLDSFKSSGRECRRVRHEINPGRSQPTARYAVTSCLQPDGTWRLDSQARPDSSQ